MKNNSNFHEYLTSNTSAYPEIDEFLERLTPPQMDYLEGKVNLISKNNHNEAAKQYLDSIIKRKRNGENCSPEIGKVLLDGKKLTVSDIRNYARENLKQIEEQFYIDLLSCCINYEKNNFFHNR